MKSQDVLISNNLLQSKEPTTLGLHSYLVYNNGTHFMLGLFYSGLLKHDFLIMSDGDNDKPFSYLQCVDENLKITPWMCNLWMLFMAMRIVSK